jgi:pimeloyl-ACP methyl ester carboxylesterase
VPAIADTHRVYRPDLLGCGLSDQPTAGYRYTLETIGAQILAVLDALTLPRVHWPEFAVSGHTEANCLIYGLFLLRQFLA